MENSGYDMKSKSILTVIISVFIAFSAVFATLVYVNITKNFDALPTLVISDLIFLLSLSVVTCLVLLKISIKRTLYAYKNIVLSGGIIFFMMFLIATSVFSIKNSGNITLKLIYDAVLSFPRTFSFYALFVIVAISVLIGISNISLIKHEGFRVGNMFSILLAAFYIIGTVLVYISSDILTKRLFERSTNTPDLLFTVFGVIIPLTLLIILCYFECIFAGVLIMGYATAHKKPSYDKDYIIILGCSIDKKGGLRPLLKGRVNAAIRFAWDQEIASGKPLKYIPSGGKGENEVMSEGSAMELYLMTKGAESYEIYPEKNSSDTYENMEFSKEIIKNLNPNAKVAFATTNYHILRSGILARYAGLDAEGIAGDTKWYFWPNGFIREFFGIIMLKKKTHIILSVITAIICTVIGLLGYFGNLI